MKDKTKTKWGIKLPSGSNILVKVGDMVEKDQVVAEAWVKKVEIFNFSSFFCKIGPEKLLEINDKFKGLFVNRGDLICSKGSLFSGKICFPESGNFLEIDEFGNLKIELEDNKRKEIKAPVKSKVSKIEDGKLVLDFWVKEFKGEGLVEGKVWGDGEAKLINEFNQLTFDLESKILFTDNLDPTFLLKAEVVGVVGVVTTTKKDELKTKMPIIYLDNDIWQSLLKFSKQENRFLLNSKLGRLLLVIE